MNQDIASENFNQFFLRDKSEFPELMANLQDEAIREKDHIKNLYERGISIFRINCSFGNNDLWENISHSINKLDFKGGQTQLLFDLSGKKVRIESIRVHNRDKNSISLTEGSILRIYNNHYSTYPKGTNVFTNLKSDFSFCKPGDIIRFDDSKIVGHITDIENSNIEVKIDNVIGDNLLLTVGKGINFPNSILPNSGLSKKDKLDISFMMEFGDILCLSFIQDASDLIDIRDYILSQYDNLPPIVIKIETGQAILNLDEIFETSKIFPKVSILVARGDLVSECGWEQLAKLQEKIYLKSKEYNLPVILATGILEEFNQTGTPTRAEMLDFEYAKKFDCLLINKGDFMFDVIDFCNKSFEDMK